MTVIAYVSEMWASASGGERQGVLFFAALYGFLTCSWSALQQVRIRRWTSVRGRLIDHGIGMFGARTSLAADRTYAVRALYEYEVDGRIYSGSRLSSWIVLASRNARAVLRLQMRGIETFEDGGVTVHVHPRDPARSYLIKPGMFGLLLTVTIAAGLPLLYALDYHV